MITYLVGFVDEVRPNIRTDKKTGEVFQSTEVTVTFEAKDKGDYLVKSTETISFPFSDFEKYLKMKNQYIAVPYRFMNTKNGSYMFPDENLTAVTFSENPLILKGAKK